MPVLGSLFGHDPFTRQRAGHENGLASTARHAATVVAAVSYTHLDVYKRQGEGRDHLRIGTESTVADGAVTTG